MTVSNDIAETRLASLRQTYEDDFGAEYVAFLFEAATCLAAQRELKHALYSDPAALVALTRITACAIAGCIRLAKADREVFWGQIQQVLNFTDEALK